MVLETVAHFMTFVEPRCVKVMILHWNSTIILDIYTLLLHIIKGLVLYVDWIMKVGSRIHPSEPRKLLLIRATIGKP